MDRFRGPGICELCQKRVRNRHPHHIICRGLGGGHRLDHPWNLLAVCFAFQGGDDCHEKIHMATLTIRGRLTREDLFVIVSLREGVSVDEIEREVYRLRRLPKERISTAGGVTARTQPIGNGTASTARRLRHCGKRGC